MASIYRKSALDKISNPDKLDNAIVVSSPMSWLAIVGIALIFVSAIVWAFLGKLPETIMVDGVFSSGENIFPVYSDYSGKISYKSDNNTNSISVSGKQLNSEGGFINNKEFNLANYTITNLFETDASVSKGDEVARLTPREGSVYAACYVPFGKKDELKYATNNAQEDEDNIKIVPVGEYSEKIFSGKIVYIGKYPINTTNNVTYVAGNIGSYYFVDQPYVIVVCEIKINDENDFEYDSLIGSMFKATIITDKNPPIDKLFNRSDSETET